MKNNRTFIILFTIQFLGFQIFSQRETYNVNVNYKKDNFGQITGAIQTISLVSSVFSLAKILRSAKQCRWNECIETTYVPLSIDINDYSTIALVDVEITIRAGFLLPDINYLEQYLLASPLKILNPKSDKKKYKADNYYLRNEKHKDWLYLDFLWDKTEEKNFLGVLTLKDYEGNIVYKVSHINTPLSLIFLPLIGLGGSEYYFFSQDAIENEETVEPINTNQQLNSDEALEKLKKAKLKLDLQIISQEDYDKIKNELIRFIE
jgi:hypothetical protein|tara:strand:+ start:429 stop:1217 length:789 start_codon:yes stop_codon:yes gene_type:complete